jgi:hypothetical protein
VVSASISLDKRHLSHKQFINRITDQQFISAVPEPLRHLHHADNVLLRPAFFFRFVCLISLKADNFLLRWWQAEVLGFV